MPSTPILWHIPLSHYNEKVRWTLDYKQIPHHRRVLGPNYLTRHPASQWALGIYRRHRGKSAEVPRGG